MLIKRQSMLTGAIHEMDLPVTNEQLAEWMSGSLIQNVMTHLSPDQREFLMTGTIPEEWDAEVDIIDDILAEYTDGAIRLMKLTVDTEAK